MKPLQHRKNLSTFQAALHTLCSIGFLFAFMVLPTDVNSQTHTVHALLVIMDADATLLSTAMKNNREHVENLLTTVGSEGDMVVKTQHLLSSQNTATKTRVMEWLEKVAPGDDDVVFVYFSGMGRTTQLAEAPDEPSVFLQDGELHESDIAEAIQGIATGKLKLLITDRCNALLKVPPILGTEDDVVFDKALKIKHLFREHEGFVHLTGTSANQYGWADADRGSIFTDTLIHIINQSSGPAIDKNGDAFIEWQEIFEVTQQTSRDRFQSAYTMLSKSMQEKLRARGDETQTPTAYAFPKPSRREPKGPESPLWSLTNSNASFNTYLKTERAVYELNDNLKLDVLTEQDAHIVIFNWDEFGRLTILFPNTYQLDNAVEADRRYQLPDARANFDIQLSGPASVEWLKLIAFRRKTDSRAVIDYFPQDDKGFQVITRRERKTVEERILRYLRQMNPRDWATTTQTFEVRESITPNYSIGDIVYIEDDGNKYFARVTDEVADGAETVSVRIYNDKLREKLGRKISTSLVVGKRTTPEKGWGKQKVILSFYRGGEWITTRGVVAFEDHFMLPEKIDDVPVRGRRTVEFDEVRFPSVQHKDTEKH